MVTPDNPKPVPTHPAPLFPPYVLPDGTQSILPPKSTASTHAAPLFPKDLPSDGTQSKVSTHSAPISPPDLPADSTPSSLASPSFGLSLRFKVIVGAAGSLTDLGYWKSCKGLAVTFKHRVQLAGGNYDSPAGFLPETLEYGAITLERGMYARSAGNVQQWLRSVADEWFGNADSTYRGTTAAIVLADAANQAVYQWELRNVYPSKWTGPTLDAMGTGGVAIETLELIHQGFL